MIDLMKYTYMLDVVKIESELERLWKRYLTIINSNKPSWEEVNEARALLYLTGQVYCEQVAVGAIERRLGLLQKKLTMVEFLTLVDTESEQLKELNKDTMFQTLGWFYRVVKKYKNRYIEGKYYLEEEKFIKKYAEVSPVKELKMGYRGSKK